MGKYTFENIEYEQQNEMKAFVASIRSSTFHWHYEYELIILLDGSITVRVDNGTYKMEPGDLLLVNSRTVHSIDCETGSNLCGIIQLDPAILRTRQEDERYFHFYLNSVLNEMPPTSGYDRIRKRTAQILLCTLQESEISIFRIRSEIYGLVTDLMTDVEYDISMRANQFDQNAKLLMDIIEFTRKNLSLSNLQDEILKTFGLGEKTLYRFFKNNLSMSVKDFIDEMKVDEAKKMLQKTDQNISYIYDVCGFGSEKTFYRVFQQFTKMTPNRYRKLGMEQPADENVRGYLDFEPYMAEGILKKFLSENER